MTTIVHKGNKLALSGDLPPVGSIAPDFKLVLGNLDEIHLSDLGDKIKVLLCMPSVDTSTCALETKTFNQKLADDERVAGLVITKDLPFALKRFCAMEGISNVRSASDFREGVFAKNYGVEIMDGNLRCLHARAVFVLDSTNKIVYSELVSDLSNEPDYQAALHAIASL